MRLFLAGLVLWMVCGCQKGERQAASFHMQKACEALYPGVWEIHYFTDFTLLQSREKVKFISELSPARSVAPDSLHMQLRVYLVPVPHQPTDSVKAHYQDNEALWNKLRETEEEVRTCKCAPQDIRDQRIMTEVVQQYRPVPFFRQNRHLDLVVFDNRPSLYESPGTKGQQYLNGLMRHLEKMCHRFPFANALNTYPGVARDKIVPLWETYSNP